MRRPLIAGNWKMYKTIGQAVEFAEALTPLVAGNADCDVIVAPAFTAIWAVANALEGSAVGVSAQDVAAEPGPGAFTGEVSAAMVKDAGASFAIVGHSERRAYYAETDASVNKKVRCSIKAGLESIVCVGESLHERDAGHAEKVVGAQLSGGLVNLTLQDASRIIIAYEPVWAIGTGRTATPEIAQQMHAFIRSQLRKMFGESVAESTRILYGGSVKPDNTAGLMEQADIDGALVGGASLEPDSFAAIVNFSRK
ncbi:MAG TPA: triose-phosphate isomerase [Blastocatellia bacterium]|nr:triose-phosphate isomerase [Blastocatellia bacterium]